MATDAAELAREHYAARQALVTATAAEAARQWSTVDPQAIAQTWRSAAVELAVAVTAAQQAAAQQADPYIQAAVAAGVAAGVAGAAAGAAGGVAAGALAGVAADGRDLLSLLYHPAAVSLLAVRAGQDEDRALAVGLFNLETIARTEVADAGRTADQIALVTHGVGGYARLIQGAATCSRCLILAGRWYPWSAGFQRHPRCLCVHVPATRAEAGELTASVEDVYAGMTPEQRSRAGWSKGDQAAIDAGADITRVTNAHRGVYVAGGRQYTRESTTKRRGVSPGLRPTPAHIMREARGDRDQALRLLARFGYIT